MSVHHATKKKAEGKGILIEDAPEGSNFQYRAFWPERALELWGNDSKSLADAMVDARMAALEYGIRFEQDLDTGHVAILVGVKKPREVGKVEDVADLPSVIADVLEALTDSERTEIEESDDLAQEEEEERGGSVVPNTYKRKYASEGHPGTCGDWLAQTLDPLVTNGQGKLDADAMEEIARINGLDVSKLTRTTPGWQGRFRMTARNMLVRMVAKQGFLFVPSVEGDPTQEPAPAEWLAANQPKVNEPGDRKAARKLKGA